MKQSLRLFLFFLVPLLAAAMVSAARGQSEPALLFVIDGQSNSGSQGDGDELSEYWLEVGDEILLYSPQFTGVKQFVSAPHNSSKARWDSRFGAELGLYEAIRAQYPDRVVAFARRSRGGTSITEWCSSVACNSTQYTKAQNLIGAATSKLLARSDVDSVEIAAIIWIQIEADTPNISLATNYADRLAQLIESHRHDAGDTNLPFLFIAPHTHVGSSGFPIIDAGVREVASGTPRTAIIETIDLSTQDDGIHFDTAGMVELGRRFGAAWLEIQGQ